MMLIVLLSHLQQRNKERMKYAFTSSDPRGGCRGFPHTRVNLSNCQRCKKFMIQDL